MFAPQHGCLDGAPPICKAARDLGCSINIEATARPTNSLGMWAGKKLGFSGSKADSYALSVVMADLEASEHDVAGKIRKDFDAKGVSQSDHQIARTMTHPVA